MNPWWRIDVTDAVFITAFTITFYAIRGFPEHWWEYPFVALGVLGGLFLYRFAVPRLWKWWRA